MKISEAGAKKHHPMVFGLWIGFMGFAGIVALLFWLVLHFSVGIQYQKQVEKELDGAVQSVWEMYGQTDFDTNISFLAGTSSYFIQILSEEGGEPLLSVNSQGESARPQQENIADVKLFERLDASEGFCNYYVEDETHDSQWAVSAVVLANLKITGS